MFFINLKDFFCLFPNMPFENTLLVDDTSHKNMFNPPCSAIFFKTFYKFHIDNNYLIYIILSYLKSLHSFGGFIKFVELNPFDSITNVPPNDPHYEKLNGRCSMKCDETFCNKIKLRFINKKR